LLEKQSSPIIATALQVSRPYSTREKQAAQQGTYPKRHSLCTK